MPKQSPLITIARKAYFSCSFKEHVSQIFYGYNYTLEAFVRGTKDPRSGLVINLTDLDLVLKKVTSELDHKDLNHEVNNFKANSPNIKSIAEYCFTQLNNLMGEFNEPSAGLTKVRLYQGQDKWAEVSSSQDNL